MSDCLHWCLPKCWTPHSPNRNQFTAATARHRCIRADKVAIGVQTFVVAKMGDRFVKPPVFDLNACFDDSSCATPLVFILSPGSDPMGAVLKAADGMGVKVRMMRETSQGSLVPPWLDSALYLSAEDVVSGCLNENAFLTDRVAHVVQLQIRIGDELEQRRVKPAHTACEGFGVKAPPNTTTAWCSCNS